ncbi:MAG: nucleoside hydrolase [Tuberibacillus sp.]
MKPIFMMDTGVDDALSILLAVRSSKVLLLGISTVSGNVHVDKALQNTKAFGRDRCSGYPGFKRDGKPAGS